MAMPKTAFAKFSEQMKTEYPDEPITCETLDWCYFYTPCEDVSKFIPSMTFTVKNSAGDDTELKIPAKSFLYQDVDYKTKLSTCHVGIVAQKYSDKNIWMLGTAFMENFYTVFDATNYKQH